MGPATKAYHNLLFRFHVTLALAGNRHLSVTAGAAITELFPNCSASQLMVLSRNKLYNSLHVVACPWDFPEKAIKVISGISRLMYLILSLPCSSQASDCPMGIEGSYFYKWKTKIYLHLLDTNCI